MTRSRKLFNLLFPMVCILVFAYPPFRISNWYSDGNGMGLLQAGVVWLVGFAGLWYSFSGPNMIVRYFVVHWMGVSFILMSLTILAEIPALLLPESQTIIAMVVLSCGVAAVIAATIASHWLRVKRVDLTSHKLSRDHRVVQISDVHIGSRQGGFMRRIVTKINTLSPDTVVITGDLIDSSAVGHEELAALADLNAPAYFVIGNHERYADLDKILHIMQTLGMKTLRQSSDIQGEVQFVGIDDADRRDQVAIMLPDTPRDHGLFNVLLYHRPVGWKAARGADMDLMLSGHTHNGQIWPFNMLVKRQFDRIKGLHQQDGGSLYVSSGTGTWGPLMRLGTSNEITLIQLQPHTDT